MGLSDQERYGKILWTVKKLEELLSGLKDNYTFKKLKTYQTKLWPAMLNNERCNHFWITGDGFSQNKFDGGFLYEAFQEQVDNMKLFNIDDVASLEADEEPSFRDLLVDRVQITSLVSGDENIIIECYQYIQNFYYAVNRYDDEMSKQFEDLKSLISNIKGELFSIISAHPIYFRAYLLSQIYNKIICFYTEDEIKKFIVDTTLYHNLSLREDLSSDFLFNTWKKLQFKPRDEISVEDRLLILIECIGRRLGSYSNQITRIQEQLKDLVDPEKLKNALDKCVSDYKLYKEAESERCRSTYQYCHLTDNYES